MSDSVRAAGSRRKPAPQARVPVCLDSSVVCTLLLQERGWQAIDRTIRLAQVVAVMPGPVLTESIVVARRKGNASSPRLIHEALSAWGLTVEHPVDADLVRAAELTDISDANPGPPPGHSDRPSTLSLADALILAVAERLGHRVLTRDAYWKWMVDNGHLNVAVTIP